MILRYSYVAGHQLAALSHADRKRIIEKLVFYCSQSNPLQYALYITTKDSYRFRVGHYRLFFEVINDVIWVNEVVRRDKAYD